MSVFDLLLVVTVVFAIAAGGMSVWVIVRHLLAWGRNERTLLPLHVWTIALSYLLLIASILSNIQEMMSRFWIVLPALFLGVYSLIPLSQHQQERKES